MWGQNTMYTGLKKSEYESNQELKGTLLELDHFNVETFPWELDFREFCRRGEYRKLKCLFREKCIP